MTKFYYWGSVVSSSPALADKSKKGGGINAENYVVCLISNIHGCSCFYYYYLYNCNVIEVSRIHMLLCAIYQNQKGVWLVRFFFNKFQYHT